VGFLERLRQIRPPAVSLETSGDPEVDAVRAATRAAASREIDLSYITSEYLAEQYGAPYPADITEDLEGAAANAAIETYGGRPLESTTTATGVQHRYLMFGHQAAKINDFHWLRRVADFQDGTWICQPTVVLGGGDARVVGTSSTGWPIWEFRM
jgi:hypothetical protein